MFETYGIDDAFIRKMDRTISVNKIDKWVEAQRMKRATLQKRIEAKTQKITELEAANKTHTKGYEKEVAMLEKYRKELATKDAYYLTVELSGNDPRIVDDVGDTDSNFSGHYELFRNLTPITLEHDGVGYAKLVADAAPKAGDYVVFADADDNLPGYLTAGEPYEIKRTDDCGDAHITDDDGDNFDMDEADYYTYAYYAKVAAPKRRPTEGDCVKVIGFRNLVPKSVKVFRIYKYRGK